VATRESRASDSMYIILIKKANTGMNFAIDLNALICMLVVTS
jgi:hypothetical protein